MTTTTKAPPKLGDQLTELVEKRDAAHIESRKAKAAVSAYDAETEGLRAEYTLRRVSRPEEHTAGPNPSPLPGTETAKLGADIKARRTAENPHQAAYVAKRDAFHVLDASVQDFRRKHVAELIAELHPEAELAAERIRGGFQAVAEGCEAYEELVARATELIVATPGLNGRHLGLDPRPRDWRSVAIAAVNSDEVAKPGLTETARWSLENE